MQDSNEGEVKIRFKKKTPVAPKPLVKKTVVKRRIAVSFVDEPEINKPKIEKPKVKKLKVQESEVEDLDLPEIEAQDNEDLDLENVFDALEHGASSAVFGDDFTNPLEHFADAPISEPKKSVFVSESEQPELTYEPRHPESRLEPERPEPQPDSANNSPFISYHVDKRPLSSARPATVKSSVIAVKNQDIAEKNLKPTETPPKTGNLGNLKRPKPAAEPVTSIAAAPKKTSSTILLFLGILGTVVVGGFVGALIYFLFFQEK